MPAFFDKLFQYVDFSLELSQADLFDTFPTPNALSRRPAESAGLVVLKHVDEGGHEVVNALSHCFCIDYSHLYGFCDEA